MENGRTHLRVCISTAELVDAIRVRLELAEEVGHIRRWWEGESLTTAELIDRIVKTYWAHMERSRASRRRKGRPAHIGEVAGRPLKSELMEGAYDVAKLDADHQRLDQELRQMLRLDGPR